MLQDILSQLILTVKLVYVEQFGWPFRLLHDNQANPSGSYCSIMLQKLEAIFDLFVHPRSITSLMKLFFSRFGKKWI